MNSENMNNDYVEDLTGEINVEVNEVEAIGVRIKSIREEKGLSLDELSNLTGFEVDILARLENMEFQPQLGTVLKLSKALDSAFSRLISNTGSKLYSITRKDEQREISRSTSRKSNKQLYTYKSLAPEVKGRNMESLIVELEEKLPESEKVSHNGEEFIYVLEGVVEMMIGEEVFDLNAGDSIYYLSTTPHLISSKKGTSKILAVLYGGH